MGLVQISLNATPPERVRRPNRGRQPRLALGRRSIASSAGLLARVPHPEASTPPILMPVAHLARLGVLWSHAARSSQPHLQKPRGSARLPSDHHPSPPLLHFPTMRVSTLLASLATLGLASAGPMDKLIGRQVAPVADVSRWPRLSALLASPADLPTRILPLYRSKTSVAALLSFSTRPSRLLSRRRSRNSTLPVRSRSEPPRTSRCKSTRPWPVLRVFHSLTCTPLTTLCRYFHTITTTSGTGAQSSSAISAQIAKLNSVYSPTFSFTLAGTDVTVNNDYYNKAGPEESLQSTMKNQLRKGGKADLNVGPSRLSFATSSPPLTLMTFR